tara:strand:+ start:327 stop:1928 length:1602 start_codon:yes stop_codon:yes gene_type:complete
MINMNKINSVKIIIIAIVWLLVLTQADAFTTNGTGKTFDFAITSGKNNELSGADFNTFLVVGDNPVVANSSNFKTELGFIRTAHYLDGEACQIAAECAGGFCCSSACQSTSCPVEEEAAAAAGAAAAGGAGFVRVVEYFSIDTDLIRALIKQGGTYKAKFTIKNIYTENLLFDIDISELDDILLLSDVEFQLEPNEIKIIDVTIFAGEEKKPDIYSGNIKITANNIKKSLPVIVEVRAKKALFDIKVSVNPQNRYILKNESVIADITLTNVGDLKPVDVELYYAIRDIEGNDLVFGFETLAVYDEVSRIKELELPTDITFGTYIFYAKVTYGLETAASGDIFYVVIKKPATCFDGIQNQQEQGIDCSGPCKKCKRTFADFFKSIPLSIYFGVIIIVFAIIAFIILRKPSEEIYKKKHTELQRLYSFIDSALNKGHKAEHVRTMLLNKGLPEKIVNMVHNKIISDKLRNLKTKPKHIVKLVQLPEEVHKQVVDYINKALNHGYSINKIRKSLSEVGWTESEIEKQISDVLRSRI